MIRKIPSRMMDRMSMMTKWRSIIFGQADFSQNFFPEKEKKSVRL